MGLGIPVFQPVIKIPGISIVIQGR